MGFDLPKTNFDFHPELLNTTNLNNFWRPNQTQKMTIFYQTGRHFNLILTLKDKKVNFQAFIIKIVKTKH